MTSDETQNKLSKKTIHFINFLFYKPIIHELISPEYKQVPSCLNKKQLSVGAIANFNKEIFSEKSRSEFLQDLSANYKLVHCFANSKLFNKSSKTFNFLRSKLEWLKVYVNILSAVRWDCQALFWGANG